MKQDELARGQNSKGPMKQGSVEKGQNGSGLSGIRPNWLRTNWEDPAYFEIWTIEVSIGVKNTHLSILIFCFLTYLTIFSIIFM